jgi:SAM-dependent methyltransferase
MRDEDIDFLLSPDGEAALRELANESITEKNHLLIASYLRASLSAERAAVVLETALLRQKARRKFSRAEAMLFTREGLEQATGEIVAEYRARRFGATGITTIADLGCGIGGDTIALAKFAKVIAVDRLRLNARLARINAAAYGVGETVWPVQGDLEQLSPIKVEAFFFDPARRTPSSPRTATSRRLHSTRDYLPPLSLIDAWRILVPNGAVKVSPGIDYAEIPADAEVEFISLNGELKEGLLWYGELRNGSGRRAALLPGGHTLSERDLEPKSTIAPPAGFLYEPDAAIIRAHLVGQLANLLDAAFLNPDIAYLTAETPRLTPFAHCYQVEDFFPFQLKRLRSYLRKRDIGQVTIKKRGSPLDPDDLRQALRLQGKSRRILFLTQAAGLPIVLVARSWCLDD